MDSVLRLCLSETTAIVLRSRLPADMTMPVVNTFSEFASATASGVVRLWQIPQMLIWKNERPDIMSSVWLSESGQLVSMAYVSTPNQAQVQVIENKTITYDETITIQQWHFWALAYWGGPTPDVPGICGFLADLRKKAEAYAS